MLKWKVYYADNSTFSSDDGEPWEAPGYGVQAVCQPEPDVGLETLHAFDYYIYRRGCWLGIGGHDGLVDHMISYAPEIKAVLAGRQIPRQDYQVVMRLALHDPDFPRKSATHAGESPA